MLPIGRVPPRSNVDFGSDEEVSGVYLVNIKLVIERQDLESFPVIFN